jgi:shikimate kinase
MPLIDTDDVIERDNGVIIADIFLRHGEPHFRDLECVAIRKVSGLGNYIVSTGGGVVLRESNLEMLKRNGTVFCLTATPEEIWQRIGHENHRPLLQTPDPLGKIRQMLTARAPYYSRADYQIPTTGVSVEQVTNQIIEVFKHAIHSC